MNNIEQPTQILETVDVPKGKSWYEVILSEITTQYAEEWNKNNDKSDIAYDYTLTTHKIATKEGNKDVAYLRLNRRIAPKGTENWDEKLIHHEMYMFKSMQERVNPDAKWKEFLFANMFARLVVAGLEYAELLQRLAKVEKAEKEAESKIEVTNQMPAPLTTEDEKYKQWLAAERAKEGL